jgi:hypothetical protein
MAMILIAAMMLAQAPAAPPSPNVKPSQITVKQKPDVKCVYIEVTGSRQRQKVCNDGSTLDPSISGVGPNAGMFHAPPPATPPTSIGGRPH